MIYIFAALYAEAKPLIQRFQLKKTDTKNPFDEFHNEETGIRLVLTGVGSIAAATAVSNICSCYSVEEEDFLINFGSCAGDTLGKLFLCNKLTEKATGKTFYPDILYQHSFAEKAIITETGVLKDGLVDLEVLHDMEATAIYQAGSYFVAPHQMFFLKVVSDAGKGELDRLLLQTILEQQMDVLEAFLKELQEISEIEKAGKKIFTKEEERKITQFCKDLHCSQTMEASVWQCARYGKLSGILYEDVIDRLYQEGVIPCKDKREGKIYFEEFRKQVL